MGKGLKPSRKRNERGSDDWRKKFFGFKDRDHEGYFIWVRENCIIGFEVHVSSHGTTLHLSSGKSVHVTERIEEIKECLDPEIPEMPKH